MRTGSRRASCGMAWLLALGCSGEASVPLAPAARQATAAVAREERTESGLDVECDRVEFAELPAIAPDGAPALHQVRRLYWASCALSGHGQTALYLDDVVTVLPDGSESGAAMGSLTFADGSILRLHAASRAPDRGAVPFVTYRLDLSFIGGTGRMVGATGRVRGILFVDFFARLGVLQGDGVLRAD